MKKLLKWTGIIIGVFIVVGMLFSISGCVEVGEKAGTTEESPKIEEEETQAKESFTNENYNKLASSPDKYKGCPVELVGEIFAEVEEGEKQTRFQMWADPANAEGNTVVIYNSTGLDLKSDDFVRVTGEVEGSFEGENLMGGTITAVRIIASEIEKVSSADALAPTEHTVQVEETQNQHGIEITIEKIEFANNETRVFVRVKNNSKSSAYFREYDAKLVQGSTQFEPEDNFKANYPEIQSELLPGIESSGVIAFKAIGYSTNSCKIYFEASSDNYDLDFEPYVFNIVW